MSRAYWYTGDTRKVLATLPDGSVDLVMSSPPFLALRSYLPADHPDKALEIGSEATPGEFLDVLLDVVEECARVLAPHGSLVFELGDTYAGSGGAGGDYSEGGLRDGAPGFGGSAKASRSGWHRVGARAEQGDQPPNYRKDGTVATSGGSNGGIGWPLDKSKVLIPQLFAIALAYGFNPLTGRTTEPWRVRNTVAWCRPNPPVGRDGDKFRPATSFLTVACKARDRYWDGDAVRVAYSANSHARTAKSVDAHERTAKTSPDGNRDSLADRNNDGAGAPLLDWWEIPTAPYKGSHYATYPPDLVVPVVKAMCPLKVCRTCGAPSVRITETAYVNPRTGRPAALKFSGERLEDGVNQWRHDGGDNGATASNTTLGWSDCGHDDYRTGLVLDPFAGSGTTLAVATGHGRDAIGIDLDPRNYDLARERVGMFLELGEDATAVSWGEKP